MSALSETKKIFFGPFFDDSVLFNDPEVKMQCSTNDCGMDIPTQIHLAINRFACAPPLAGSPNQKPCKVPEIFVGAPDPPHQCLHVVRICICISCIAPFREFRLQRRRRFFFFPVYRLSRLLGQFWRLESVHLQLVAIDSNSQALIVDFYSLERCLQFVA
jgi:hypothetical protein